MGKFDRARVDRAAGGVVINAGSVLVVHRPRYDDWSLPKGHVDPGEAWVDAALREVLEETGVVAEVIGDPVPVAYLLAPELPKIVLFYPMAHKSVDGNPDPAEVDLVEWWPLGRATTELSYDVERSLIASWC